MGALACDKNQGHLSKVEHLVPNVGGSTFKERVNGDKIDVLLERMIDECRQDESLLPPQLEV